MLCIQFLSFLFREQKYKELILVHSASTQLLSPVALKIFVKRKRYSPYYTEGEKKKGIER